MQKLTLLIFITLLAGCGKTAYNGQAFVKTLESTTKISDLEIQLISPSAINENISKFKENLSKIAIESDSRIKNINLHLVELETLKSVVKIIASNEEILKPLEPGLMKAVREEIAKLDEIKKLKIDNINESIKSLQAALNPSIYFMPNYGSELIRTRTDADGRFKLNFDGKSPAVVIANRDQRYWFVTLPKPSDEPLYLTESNQHGAPSCDSCFFNSDSSKTVVSAVAMYAKSLIGDPKTVAILDPAAANKKDTLYLQALTLASKHNNILNMFGQLPVTKSLVERLSGPGKAEAQYEIRKAEISLGIDVLQAQEKSRELSKLILERAVELKKRLSAT